jgi:hypothetical protein
VMRKPHLLPILAILLVGVVVGMSRKRTWRMISKLRPKVDPIVDPIVERWLREDYGTIVAPTG